MEAMTGGGGCRGRWMGLGRGNRSNRSRGVADPLFGVVLRFSMPLDLRCFGAGANERPKRRVLQHSVVRPPCRITRQYHGGTKCIDAWEEQSTI